MKTIELEIPDGKRAKWVDGVLTLVDDKPIEYKFKVGDKVYYDGRQYKIKERFVHCGEPSYKFEGHSFVAQEWLIEISTPEDITERIKTFEDARRWCVLNNYGYLEREREECSRYPNTSPDILAYLKLRIITCALNEGWEPALKEDEERWHVEYDVEDDGYICDCSANWEAISPKLMFKSAELAEYAATQFADIYADFCGCKKGGEA